MNEKAITHLIKDPILAKAIIAVELPHLEVKRKVFVPLLRSITSQQLSLKAAATIYGRFLNLFERNEPSPTAVLGLDIETLRSVGLSRQKASYIQNVAAFAKEHKIDEIDWDSFTDSEIVSFLSQIKGVGVWTVQMLMMFTLVRMDVFPTLDLGIQQGMNQLYDLESKGKILQKEMIEIAEKWRPYRSVASRYIWAWKDKSSKK